MSTSGRLVLTALFMIVLARSIYASSLDSTSFAVTVLAVDGDPDAIAVADVNEDGAPDIILANPQDGTVSVMLGDRKGSFHKSVGSPFPAGHLPNDLGIGDFNGDGHLDLLIVNTQTAFVTLLFGNGQGGFHPAPGSPFMTNAKPHPHGVAIGHFCGRNQPLDAVIDSWGTGEVELLLNDGTGTLRNGPQFPAGPGSDMPLRSVDLNQDGIPDVVMPDTAIGQWNSNAVTVLLGDGKCGFQAAPGSPFNGGAVPWSVAIGDFDSDGIPDLLMVPYGPRVKDPHKIGASVLLGDGHGGFHAMPGSPFDLPGCGKPRRIAIGSVMGNSTHDFAVTCMNTDTVLLFHSEGGKTPKLSSLEVGSGAQSVPEGRGALFADLLARGRDDIIISNEVAGTITLLLSK